MDGYMLFRKEGKTALVLISDSNDELYYLVSKLSKTRNKQLKKLAKDWLEEFFEQENL